MEYLKAANRNDALAPKTKKRNEIEIRKLEREMNNLGSGSGASSRSAIGGGGDDIPGANLMGCCETCLAYIWNACAPCRMVIGGVLAIFSLLIVVSIGIHLGDQAKNSDCGYSCGFSLPTRTIENPIGMTFDQASKVFPFDYVLVGGVILWFFVCTLYGVTQIGVRFFCVRMYNFRPGKTPHNGLMMAIWFVMFVVLAINIQLLSLAPNYAMFGHQFYLGGKSDTSTSHASCVVALKEPSTFNKAYATAEQKALYKAYPENYLCVHTQLYGFYVGITIHMPIFGLIFFVGQWLFLLAYLVGLICAIVCPSEGFTAEETALLQGKPKVESIFY